MMKSYFVLHIKSDSNIPISVLQILTEMYYIIRRKVGYIDAGDGSWRPNVLVTTTHKILVTVSAILVTIIRYIFTLASGTNIQKMSLTSTNRQQL